MKREKKKNLKLNIFNELNFRLSLLIEHIIWFDKYKDAEFINWNNNIESFTDIKFIIYISQFYESEKITFEEAVYKLEKLIKKYDLENYSMLPDSQKETI